MGELRDPIHSIRESYFFLDTSHTTPWSQNSARVKARRHGQRPAAGLGKTPVSLRGPGQAHAVATANPEKGDQAQRYFGGRRRISRDASPISRNGDRSSAWIQGRV